VSNIYPLGGGLGVFELPNPDARPPRRGAHDVLVDQRPVKRSRWRRAR